MLSFSCSATPEGFRIGIFVHKQCSKPLLLCLHYKVHNPSRCLTIKTIQWHTTISRLIFTAHIGPRLSRTNTHNCGRLLLESTELPKFLGHNILACHLFLRHLVRPKFTNHYHNFSSFFSTLSLIWEE